MVGKRIVQYAVEQARTVDPAGQRHLKKKPEVIFGVFDFVADERERLRRTVARLHRESLGEVGEAERGEIGLGRFLEGDTVAGTRSEPGLEVIGEDFQRDLELAGVAIEIGLGMRDMERVRGRWLRQPAVSDKL